MTTISYGKAAGALVLLLLIAGCDDKKRPDLTPETYADYKARIGPKDSDEAWQKIDWLPSYRDGLEAAAKQQQPILLWVMNGHPLGCT